MSAGSLAAHEYKTDLLSAASIDIQKTLVEIMKLLIRVVFESSVGEKIVLDLDEVASIIAVLDRGERSIHLHTDKLSLRLCSL